MSAATDGPSPAAADPWAADAAGSPDRAEPSDPGAPAGTSSPATGRPTEQAEDGSTETGATGVGQDEAVGRARPGLFGRLLRAGATSIMATILSHSVYIALLAAAHADATLASSIAFVIGASFNYFIGRRLTWGRTNRPHPVKEMLPYVIVIAAGGAVSVGVATLVQHIITPMGLTNTERTVVLEIANIVSYGAVFFFKFTLLDRLVFRHH